MKLYKIFRKPPFFLRASTWMSRRDNPVKHSKNSRQPVIIPLLLIQYGSMMDKFKGFRVVMPSLRKSLLEMHRSAKQITRNPHIGKKTIDPKTLQEVETYAYELGISKIGYTKVNPDFIFNGFEVLYENVMMVGMEMKREAIRHNPSEAATQEIWRTYSGLGVAVNKIANFLREKGYNCQASPAVGGDVMTTPIAQDAGIGVVGKNGLLITPEFGPSLRLAAIFLDIDNLPLKTLEDNEHLWVRDFCDSCNHCVNSCPGKAIFKETKTLEDGHPQFIDREKCAPYFSKNCSQCISSCPFIMGSYNKIKETYLKKEANAAAIEALKPKVDHSKVILFNIKPKSKLKNATPPKDSKIPG